MFLAPMPIGPFLIQESGQLTLRVPEPVPSFTFVWRGIPFTIRLTAGTLTLRAQAGRIPSTADGRGKREEAMAVLRALPAVIPPALRLRLLPDYRIQIETARDLDWPTTAAALIAPIFAMVITLAPLLDLLEEAGLRPA
jgi:hypothetical protein